MFCDNLNTIFPAYNNRYDKCRAVVAESEENAAVKNVVWTNSSFQIFDMNLVKDLQTFFAKGNSHKILGLDCDGACLFNHDGKYYLFFSELKSNPNASDLHKAFSQIVSSYIKLNMLLNLTTNYRNEEIQSRGFIFSKPISKDTIYELNRRKLRDPAKGLSPQENFMLKLCKSKNSLEVKCSDHPHIKGLNLGERGIFDVIKVQHIEVSNSDSITLNAIKYI